jgi:hypothetical protein
MKEFSKEQGDIEVPMEQSPSFWDDIEVEWKQNNQKKSFSSYELTNSMEKEFAEKGAKPEDSGKVNAITSAEKLLKFTTEEFANEIGKQIELLGDDDYKVRDEATKLLKAIGLPALKQVALTLENSNDIEVRRRTLAILHHVSSPVNSRRLIEQQESLQTISKKRAEQSEAPAKNDYERFRATALAEETPVVSTDDQRRIAEVKAILKEVISAINSEKHKSQEPSRPADHDGKNVKTATRIASVISSIEQMEELVRDVREKSATERVRYAREIAVNDPEAALKQLAMAWKDDSQGCDDDIFYVPAACALEAANSDPKLSDTYKRWLKDAAISGMDLQHIVTTRELVKAAARHDQRQLPEDQN